MLVSPVKPKKHADLLPLMDCIFLILFIFFYLMLFMSKYDAIEVDLPNAEATLDTKINSFSISVNAQGELFHAKTPIELESLTAELTIKFKADNTTTVLLTADKKAPFESVIAIIDLVNTLEIENFAIEVSNE